MKAESMIFDADIAFDFEAQPAHANESLIGPALESSRYATASDSDLSVSSEEYDVTCIVDVSTPPPAADDMDGVLAAVASDVLGCIEQPDNQQICELTSQDAGVQEMTMCVTGDAEQTAALEPAQQDTSC